MRKPCPLDRRPLGIGNRRPIALVRPRSSAVRTPIRSHNRKAATLVASYLSAAAVDDDKTHGHKRSPHDLCGWDACALSRSEAAGVVLLSVHLM
jgi:hypothetical protein